MVSDPTNEQLDAATDVIFDNLLGEGVSRSLTAKQREYWRSVLIKARVLADEPSVPVSGSEGGQDAGCCLRPQGHSGRHTNQVGWREPQQQVADSELRDQIVEQLSQHAYYTSFTGECQCGCWAADRQGMLSFSNQWRLHIAESINDFAVAPVLAAKDAELAFVAGTRQQYSEERDTALEQVTSLQRAAQAQAVTWVTMLGELADHLSLVVWLHAEAMWHLGQAGELVGAISAERDSAKGARLFWLPEFGEDEEIELGEPVVHNRADGRFVLRFGQPDTEPSEQASPTLEELSGTECGKTGKPGSEGCDGTCSACTPVDAAPATPTEPRLLRQGDPEPPIGTTVRLADGRRRTRYELGWFPGPWNWVGLTEVYGEVEAIVDGSGSASTAEEERR